MIYQNYRSPYGDTVMEKYEVGRKKCYNGFAKLLHFPGNLRTHGNFILSNQKTGDGNKMRLENNIYIYIYIKLFSTKILCEKQCFSKQINKIKIKVQKGL